MHTKNLLLALLLSVISSPLLAQHQHEAAAPQTGAPVDLGTVSFPTSGSAQARPHFLRGLLLHSFEFQSAVQAFAQARRVDPDFAMAYWGEAVARHVGEKRMHVPRAPAQTDRIAPTSSGAVKRNEYQVAATLESRPPTSRQAPQ